MITVANATRHAALKAEARSLYLKVHRTLDGYSCGFAVACFMNADLDQAVTRFDEVMAELATFDPEAAATIERSGTLRHPKVAA